VNNVNLVVTHLIQIKNVNYVVILKDYNNVKEVITHRLNKVSGDKTKLRLLFLSVMNKNFVFLQINPINIYMEIIYVKKDILEHYANLVIIMGIF
jgi:hypothetical protein